MAPMSKHEEQLTELMGTLDSLRSNVQILSARLTSAAVALEDADGRLGRFTAVCQRVAALHAPHAAGQHQLCVACCTDWPCRTAAALQELLSG